ncbi:MAG: AAA family ATPase [Clostridia bacterium]|nr:AAA family ATPase [Clostridia bacterium]
MKHIYLIGGTMGVGKTTTCQILKQKLPNAVFLDGDWCWDSSPFQVNEETKAMVMDNICHILCNFIRCSAYENIIFCWVMHEQSIIDDIVSRLDLTDCKLHSISLVCSEDALRERITADVKSGIRKSDVIERSVERIPLYYSLDTAKVDVSNITSEEAAERISKLK